MRTFDSQAQPVAPLSIDVVGRLALIDQVQLRAYRLERLRAELKNRDYMGCLLADPINIRYATGSRNMTIWTMHSPGRWAFVPVEGPIVLYEFSSSMHLSAGLETIAEMRPSTPWFFFLAGSRAFEKVGAWADEIAEIVKKCGGGNRRLAVDRCEPLGAFQLKERGVQLFDAQEPIEIARMIKSKEEISTLQLAMDVCDVGVTRMREALKAGVTENQIWAMLHDVNIAHGGEWIEGSLLSSGERTNPWFQEASHRVILGGDLVAFDTDMVGPGGYLADISRTWICPGAKPTNDQSQLYRLAEEQVLHNLSLIKPGLSFREFAEKSWLVPEEFMPNRYMMLVHGVGLVDEYPSLPYGCDFDDWGYEGHFDENMVISVESYMGKRGGKNGVKLEQQALITPSGLKLMSKIPFEDALTF